MQLVTGFDFLQDRHRRMLRRGNLRERFVVVRIEGFPLRRNAGDLVFRQRFQPLLQDHLHPLPEVIDRPSLLRGRDRPLQVVKDRQKVLRQGAGGVAALLVPLALHTLAIVVEFRVRAKQAVLAVVPFGERRGQQFRDRDVLSGIGVGGVGSRCRDSLVRL